MSHTAFAVPFRLRPTRYDHAASWLIAWLILTGFFVSLMAVAWVLSLAQEEETSLWDSFPNAHPTHRAVPAGYVSDLDEPNKLEMDELLEPQLESALAAVTDLVSHVEAVDASGQGVANVGQAGDGDGRTKGPPGPVGGAKPRWDRWRIKYNTDTLASYTKQLDYFQIELAAVGGGRSQVDYARQLASRRPKRRKASGDKEKRLYFSWQDGKLRAFDRQLLARAGIATNGRVILQFVSKDLENRLAMLEREYAKSHTLGEIQQTVFRIRAAGSKYEFYVESMQFRTNSD